MNDYRNNPIPTCYYPDTGQPVPMVLTEPEVIRFMRLDLSGTKDPGRCLKRYRKLGLLDGVQIGKRLCYHLVDVLQCVERLKRNNPR